MGAPHLPLTPSPGPFAALTEALARNLLDHPDHETPTIGGTSQRERCPPREERGAGG